MDTKSAANRVEELCGKPQLDATNLVKLRNAARFSLEGRNTLQERLGNLESENLSPDERTFRKAAYCWILGPSDEADKALKQAGGPLKAFVEGCIASDRGAVDSALQKFQETPGAASQIESANALIQAGNFEEAAQALQQSGAEGEQLPDYWYNRGLLNNATGHREEATSDWEKALELDPEHAGAGFELAYILDLRGEDEKAIELYRRVVKIAPTFTSAAVNLGLLLEDKSDTEGAIASFKSALSVDPSNRRASMYLRDILASLNMYYDETEAKENERLEAVLRLPLNDFELSVRSRNCLAKMNLKTLGDLVRKSETELMNYKNFGETSLREIRALLESKGLRLGMTKDDEMKRFRRRSLNIGGPENPNLAKTIADLDLSVRARKCMQRLGIDSVGELCDRSEAELSATKNFGQTSLIEIKKKLSEIGLSLKSIS